MKGPRTVTWGVAATLAAAGCATQCPREGERTTFQVVAPYALTSLDPHAANTVSNYSVLSNVYEPLVATDADLKVQPALAERWENPDPLTWVLHLRPNVRFHSGRALRPQDVVYTIRRILGSRELEMQAYVLTVAEVEEAGPRTVRIRTSRPVPILLNKLHFVLVVPEGSNAHTLADHPDGTGPYRVQQWKPGESIDLVRNEGHWAPPVDVAAARFVFGVAPEDSVQGLVSGRFQLAQVNAADLEGPATRSGRHEVMTHDNIYIKYVGYDLGRDETPYCKVRPNPFRNVDVRRALHLAVDRRALAAALPNHASPATQPVPRFIFGFDPDLPVPEPDLAEARRLLARAGLSGGFEADFHVRRMFTEPARIVAEQLARVGVRLKAQVIGDPEFFDRQNRGELTVWMTRYGCPTGDASDIMDNVLHSGDAVRHFGMQNWGNYRDPVMDAAVERASVLDAVEERRSAAQEVMALSMRELPILPLYSDQDVYAVDRAWRWRPRADSYIRLSEVRKRD